MSAVRIPVKTMLGKASSHNYSYATIKNNSSAGLKKAFHQRFPHVSLS